MDTHFPLQPIGQIKTPFQQKFAIPRQPNLAQAPGTVYFQPEFSNPQTVKGLDQYSHLWLLFIFHATASRGWKPAVKAPRLGGNATLGVFASRSTHRPNSIGMSVVKNEGWQIRDGKLTLDVRGVDLLDQTPIVDIKPYLRYADSVTDASDPLPALAPIPQRPVAFAKEAESALGAAEARYPGLRQLIGAILGQDPRPAYKQSLDNDPKLYKVALYDLDIGWKVWQGSILVLALSPLASA